MKKKTINAVLSKKFEDWKESITDEGVRQLVEKNTIITGGCITSMLLRESVNDFDIYFTNKETVLAVSRYYVAKFKETHPSQDIRVIDGDNMDEETTKSLGGVGLNMTPDRVKVFIKSAGVAQTEDTTTAGRLIDEIGEEAARELLDEMVTIEEETTDSTSTLERYRPVFLSANAITLSDKIQIVIRFYGDSEEIHKNYDFIHCTNFWTSKERVLILKQEALEAILAKELRYVGSKYPLASIIRTRKFIKRGWSINAGQYLKMAFQVSNLNLSNVDTLEDQLTGVDLLYFENLISAIREAQKEKEAEGHANEVIDFGYITTIIDKMF